MKKVGELMKEAGFNRNASDSVKEAYLKHLIKAATAVNVTTPSELKEISENPQTVLAMKPALPQQLAFDFGDADSATIRTKKASTF